MYFFPCSHLLLNAASISSIFCASTNSYRKILVVCYSHVLSSTYSFPLFFSAHSSMSWISIIIPTWSETSSSFRYFTYICSSFILYVAIISIFVSIWFPTPFLVHTLLSFILHPSLSISFFQLRYLSPVMFALISMYIILGYTYSRLMSSRNVSTSLHFSWFVPFCAWSPPIIHLFSFASITCSILLWSLNMFLPTYQFRSLCVMIAMPDPLC